MRLYEIDYKTIDEGSLTFKALVAANTVEGALAAFTASRPYHKGLANHIVSVNLKEEPIIVEGT